MLIRNHVVGSVPIFELGPVQDVARVRERRDPLPLDQHGIPPDMIGMEMCAQDDIEGRARKARSFKIREEARLRFGKLFGRAPPLERRAEASPEPISYRYTLVCWITFFLNPCSTSLHW